MKIGNLEIQNRLVLAPMAKVTDIGFRILCRRYGAGLVYTEMVSANAYARKNKATWNRAKICDEERPVAVQLFSQNEEMLAKSAGLCPGDIIDLNIGCPDTKIMRQGAGSALLKRPNKIPELVKAMVDSTSKPVTVKIRTGLDRDHINAVEVARSCEKAGAAAIAIHGRNVAQKYSGKSDWEIIRHVKDSVKIPVIANGDIADEESAKRCLEQTGADFLMIGRASIGEPYLFRRISHYLETGSKLEMQALKEKLDDFFEYVRISKEQGSLEYSRLKTHAQWFLKNVEGGKKLKAKIAKTENIEEVIGLMKEFRHSAGFHKNT